ncbi:MAG: phosphoenolpyruvate synthase [Candidatus Pacebacteria bacterium]|nr:phosphoenolpyruvate synthase [Candidatus Paceibacterota bacterium]
MSEEKTGDFVKWFNEVRIEDVPSVGGKNAALGEMFSNLVPLGVNVPDGFALTADAYRHFFKQTGLDEKIKGILADLNTKDIHNLQAHGRKVREAILKSDLPEDLNQVITKAYADLEKKYGKNRDVAVRSSATAEDLPGASFAGEQETFLNVSGIANVLVATKKCIASLFTDRAISYRQDKGFSHFDVALSVGIQCMVRSDKASSGVAFTIDTETGFDKVIIINSIYGLGEFIVQGEVIPDEFIIFKPSLDNGVKYPIIAKNIGQKNIKLVYAKNGTKTEKVSPAEQQKFALTDEEVIKLSKWCYQIEKYFSKKDGHYQPMDIEWAKDGKTGELFIVQARPETVASVQDKNVLREYKLKKTSKILVEGIAVGARIGAGKVRVLHNAKQISSFKKGEVLVTEITDPDWEPIMKIASAIVTDKGGRTSHAAIVSRELGIPCIVGSDNATKVLKNGKEVTVDASGKVGNVYEGILPFEIEEHHLDKIPTPATKIMVNIGSPDEAFKNYYLPVQGVGLGRLEFIIMSHVRFHPNALLNYKMLKSGKKTPYITKLLKDIDRLTPLYKDKAQFYVDELALGVAKIAATFYPHPVIIRFSDFKTNEYRTLLGGDLYEPHEENPMLGWRGASRYYDPKFKDAFALECKAMKKVREDMGFTNVVPMIPFCRTPEEGKQVIDVMKEHGLDRAKDSTLKIYVMCEIPSNILLADQFLEVFDGMSIGSNDLTQLTLGLDRDSGIVTHIANENNEAVKKLIAEIIHKCKEKNKYIGICGQAPSDYPDFAKFLVAEGIESMSLNPDTVIKIIMALGGK